MAKAGVVMAYENNESLKGGMLASGVNINGEIIGSQSG
jgi:hypothetical protein